jgi:NitT/TauT family transport system substrate-binding protein
MDFGGAAYFAATGKANLKIVGAVQQRTVASIITLPRTKISQPKDLAGKTIAAVNGSTVVAMFPGYAKLAGLDPLTVQWHYAEAAQLPTLLMADKVNAIAQYLMGLTSVEQAAGCTGCSVILPYATYLADPYGGVLVTTDDMIKNKRDVVVRFSSAILKGLDYAIRHPEEAGTILHQRVPTSNATAATREIQLMAPYVTVGGLAVGTLDGARMARAIASLQSIGMYPPGLTPEQLVDFSIAPHSA